TRWKLNALRERNPRSSSVPVYRPEPTHAPKELNMKRILLLSLPVAMMVACSNPSNATKTDVTTTDSTAAAAAPAASVDATQLGANHWVLDNAVDASGKRIDGLFVRADKPVTLDFKDGRVGASNTCNHIGGGYTLEGDALTVGNLASTQR